MNPAQKKLADMAARIALALRSQNVKLDPTSAGLIQSDLEKAWKTIQMAGVQIPAPVAG